MSTLTLELNDSLFARLLAASQARNVPPAELARETLERTLSADDRAVESQQASAHDAPLTLTGWARKWAGIVDMEEGETRDSLRDAYMQKKFGA